MQRFNVENKKNKIYFTNQDMHHIKTVLRKKVGDFILCIDQDNNQIKAKIASLNPFIALIENIEVITINQPYNVDLYISVIKKNEFELVVQKLNELNINSITPVYFARTQMNLKLDFDRLNRIANESRKQCKRLSPIVINQPIEYKKLIEIIKKESNFLFANEKENQNSINNAKIDFNKKIGIIIGPEGGFVSSEITELQELCNSITLTNTILRAETAAIYLSSCVIEEIKKNEK